MKIYLKRFLILAAVEMLLIPPASLAQSEGQGGGRPHRDAKFEAAIKQCAEDNGIELPDPSEHKRPDRTAMETIRTCMETAGYTMPERPPQGRPPRDGRESGGGQ